MLTHTQINERLREMVALCVAKIDANPELWTFRVGASVERIADPRIREQWRLRMARPWSETRARLLATDEEADALRQNTPFGGLLTNEERIQFYRK